MSGLWKVIEIGGKCPSCGECVMMKYSERPGWQKLAVGFVIGALVALAIGYI